MMFLIFKYYTIMKTMIISIIAVLASVAVSGQSLTLTVKDVEHVEGTLYVAIYSSKENFMKKPLFGFRVAVKDRTMTIPCKGIPAGTYAISTVLLLTARFFARRRVDGSRSPLGILPSVISLLMYSYIFS